MARILNVTEKGYLHFEVTDQYGRTVEGPFDTSSAAWKALNRLDAGSKIGRPDGQQKKFKQPRPMKPGKRGKVRNRKDGTHTQLTPEQEQRQLKANARKAVGWARSVALSKFDPAGERAYRDHKLGTFGAASEVTHINPAVYLAEKAARGEL